MAILFVVLGVAVGVSAAIAAVWAAETGRGDVSPEALPALNTHTSI